MRFRAVGFEVEGFGWFEVQGFGMQVEGLGFSGFRFKGVRV